MQARSPQSIREQYLSKLGYVPLIFRIEKEKQLLIESPYEDKSMIVPGKGSIRGSVFNLAGATLGAGALSLPYAVATSGVFAAIVQLLLASCLTMYTVRLLMQAGEKTGRLSYEDLAVHCFGKKVAYFVGVNILFFCFGICVAYLVTLGDILTPLAEIYFQGVFKERWVLMSIACTFIMFPLSLLRDVSSLQFSSIMGVLSILFLVFAVSLRSILIVSSHGVHMPIHWLINTTNGYNFMLGIPIVMFAFTCQVNVFSIYTELNRPNIRRMNKVVDRATLLSLFVYMTIGFTAYFAFGSTLLDPNAKGNILMSFDLNDTIIAVSRAAITFTVAVAFPLNVFPIRFTLEMMFFSKSKASTTRHVLITTVLVYLSLIIAIFCPSINVVFGIIGGTCSSIVCFCLPAAYTLQISKQPIYAAQNLPPLLLLISSIIIGIGSTAITIYSNFQA